MEKSNFLRFLILWVSLSQALSFSLDNLSVNSSDNLVRKRRVIDRTHNANTRVRLRDVPYVVYVKNDEDRPCAGTILAAQIILTTVTCVFQLERYTVLSGTLSRISGGTTHLVNGILRHPQYHPLSHVNDIALLSIYPPIAFGENINRPIPIFHSINGQLPANTIVTVSGYGETFNRRGGVGCINLGREEPVLSPANELRTIRLPTISLEDCRARTNNNHFITNRVICTYHEDKKCSSGELGNPLVYNGHLVGILVWDGFLGDTDRFVSVASPDHRNWILTHMSLENIPRYTPPLGHPPPQNRRNSQACSRVHPCK